ncbi:hypothetical protein [Streptomyces sp. HPF1205]|uniref:hypothetical protein n=1 Tax=Streptomyces sp. HPF1205 TaxID=2873262 RepID=UPI001CED0D16|nr:hypothetical protein [Streptomyces sp. HPF1205]
MTADATPAPEEEPSLPDDVWEQFARDTERAIRASAPKEPSARARMVARRLREEDERAAAEAKRRWSGRRGSTGPTAWRSGSTDAAERRLRRRGRLRAALGILLVVLLVLVALAPGRAWSLVTGKGWRHGGSAAPAPTTLPPETVAPTAAPQPVDPDVPTLKRPFAGSPAADWQSGPAAIVLPEAAAYGTTGKARVAAALKEAKQFLVAANLDPAVLAGGRPDAALALIDPDGGTLARIERQLAHPAKDATSDTLFSRFGPEVRLAGDTVKVRGRMTVHKGSYGGVAIDADYTFVYPVRRTRDDGPSPEIARTIVRRVVTFQVVDPARYRRTPPGTLTVSHWDADIGNSACGIDDGRLHPEFASGPATAVPSGAPTPSGPALDPYDRSKPIDDGRHGCGRLSRT